MKEPDNIFFIARLREFLLLQNLQFMHAYKKKKNRNRNKNKNKNKG
jgi:hypothetical protein